MLQQTQVAAVIPRYESFLERFPTVVDLASATEEEVLASWSGLGYYRRARQLWRGARQIVDSGGDFPTTAEGWKALPGVGSYTAAAIASIAFGEPTPVLDGNVERVLSRFLALEGSVKRAEMRRKLTEAAASLLVSGAAGECNQALMEVGAVLCRPKSAGCERCPLATGCGGRITGDPLLFPSPTRRREGVAQSWRAALVFDASGRVLLVRRPSDAKVLAGSWQVPRVEAESPHQAESLLKERYGATFELGEERGTVRHAITFRRLTVTVHSATVSEEERFIAPFGWFGVGDRRSLPSSSLVQKILDLKDRSTKTPSASSRQARVPP